ncbi:unnamed protein product, partial [Cyprideis torosa]
IPNLDDLDCGIGVLAHHAVESAEEFLRKVWEGTWRVCSYHTLPSWLQDNDYLHHWHRPPLPSFRACFKSIFRVHTETGNIWTHMLGCIAFISVAIYFLSRAQLEISFEEKMVFFAFFIGAILCLGLSFMFHTVHCHSEFVGKLFSKLDYVGIALLIMGSFVPWVYYGFYCEFAPKVIYLSGVSVLGIAAITVSMFDKFAAPKYRSLRAGVFMGFGLSGVIPCIHYLYFEGWFKAMYEQSLGSLLTMAFLYILGAVLYALRVPERFFPGKCVFMGFGLSGVIPCIHYLYFEGWFKAMYEQSLGSLLTMAFLYILGAVLYALRVPERFFPGKCDIWFQSHQIFHCLVIAAAFVHYHGISEMAVYRLTVGNCLPKDDPIVM